MTIVTRDFAGRIPFPRWLRSATRSRLSLIREREAPLIATISNRRLAHRLGGLSIAGLAASLHHRWISTGQGILPGNGANRRSMRRVEVGVLGLAMPPKIDLPLESTTAKLAGERLEARVLPRVRDQVAALRERLAAHLALMRFLACDRKNTKKRLST